MRIGDLPAGEADKVHRAGLEGMGGGAGDAGDVQDGQPDALAERPRHADREGERAGHAGDHGGDARVGGADGADQVDEVDQPLVPRRPCNGKARGRVRPALAAFVRVHAERDDDVRRDDSAVAAQHLRQEAHPVPKRPAPAILPRVGGW